MRDTRGRCPTLRDDLENDDDEATTNLVGGIGDLCVGGLPGLFVFSRVPESHDDLCTSVSVEGRVELMRNNGGGVEGGFIYSHRRLKGDRSRSIGIWIEPGP